MSKHKIELTDEQLEVTRAALSHYRQHCAMRAEEYRSAADSKAATFFLGRADNSLHISCMMPEPEKK